MASFSSVIGSVAFTMFWNMVLFLHENKSVRGQTVRDRHANPGGQLLSFGDKSALSSLRTLKHLLEIQGQVGGNNADVKQVLHMLKLALLKVAEDVQYLQETKRGGQKVCPLPLKSKLLPGTCHTSSPISVLLYSKWCLSMMEVP